MSEFLEDQWLEKYGKGKEKANAMLRNYARKIGEDPDLYLAEGAREIRQQQKEERKNNTIDDTALLMFLLFIIGPHLLCAFGTIIAYNNGSLWCIPLFFSWLITGFFTLGCIFID